MKFAFHKGDEAGVLETAQAVPDRSRDRIGKKRPNVSGQSFGRIHEPILNGLECAVQVKNKKIYKQCFVLRDRGFGKVGVRRENPSQFWIREKVVPYVTVISGQQ